MLLEQIICDPKAPKKLICDPEAARAGILLCPQQIQSISQLLTSDVTLSYCNEIHTEFAHYSSLSLNTSSKVHRSNFFDKSVSSLWDRLEEQMVILGGWRITRQVIRQGWQGWQGWEGWEGWQGWRIARQVIRQDGQIDRKQCQMWNTLLEYVSHGFIPVSHASKLSVSFYSRAYQLWHIKCMLLLHSKF